MRPNRPARIENKINGILLLDKSLEITSNGALQRVKRLFQAKKAGHTGSLDPLATGMLPICFGEATKLSQFLLESDKYYRVTVTLGQRTSTGDAEGEIIESKPYEHITLEDVNRILPDFIGEIQQVPPMFSALKFQGQPLYKLARQGIEIERPSRTVHIRSLQLEAFEGNELQLYVHCTKGTYIRTLAEDIGEALGSGAYVSQLHRVAVAPYESDRMYSLDELEALYNEKGIESLYELLLPLDTCAQSYPAVYLTTAAAFYIKTGQPVMAPKMLTTGLIRLFSEDGQFIGIGEMLDDGRVAPKRLVSFSDKVAKAV